MMPHPSAGERMHVFHPQPIPSFGNKHRAQKNPSYRRGKHQFNQPRGSNHEAPSKHLYPQSCYNCGSPEHWAQHCPEPRRDLPVGAARTPRPPKRQKTEGPVATHIPSPNLYRPQRGPHRGYTHPPAAHPDYSPMPAPYAPPTPISAQQHGCDPWQQPSPESYVSYHHYGSPGLSTPMTSYGSQFPSPSSPQGRMHHQSYFSPEHQTFHGEVEYGRSSFDHHPVVREGRRQSRKKWISTENVPTIAPPIEPWMEELQSLDIPESKSAYGQIVWRPANQVARPLPSIFTDRDEISMLPSLATLPPGMSVSKYILDKGPEEFQCNIRKTEDWPFVMADPIFMDIPMECDLISIDELIARRNELFETHRIEIQEIPQELEDAGCGFSDVGVNGEDSDDQEPGNEAFDTDEDHTDTPRSSGRYSRPPSVASTAEPNRSTLSQNRALTSQHIPVARDNLDLTEGPLSPSLRLEHGNRSPRSLSPTQSYSQLPKPLSAAKQSKQHSQHDREQRSSRHQPRPNNSGYPGHKRNIPLDQRNSHFGTFKSQDRRVRKSQQIKGSVQPHQRRFSNRSKSHIDNIPPDLHGHWPLGHPFEIDHPVNLHEDYPHKHSPTRKHSERNTRKSVRRSESPNNAGDEPRRQDDDVTPKLKRRQPQVADAYSRRW